MEEKRKEIEGKENKLRMKVGHSFLQLSPEEELEIRTCQAAIEMEEKKKEIEEKENELRVKEEELKLKERKSEIEKKERVKRERRKIKTEDK